MPGAPTLVLAWRLGPLSLGTEVAAVAHVVESLPVRGVPRASPGIAGLAYYGERVLPVLDLPRFLLGETAHAWVEGAMYVIFQIDDRGYAARVDKVMRIIPTTTDALVTWSRPPDHPAARFTRALLPVDGEQLWLIDVRRIDRHLRRRAGDPAARQGV